MEERGDFNAVAFNGCVAGSIDGGIGPIPILIMHGKVDNTVPVKQSREMVEKLKAAGKTYRYVEQPNADHHFANEADRVQFLKEIEAFLTQYNPA